MQLFRLFFLRNTPHGDIGPRAPRHQQLPQCLWHFHFMSQLDNFPLRFHLLAASYFCWFDSTILIGCSIQDSLISIVFASIKNKTPHYLQSGQILLYAVLVCKCFCVTLPSYAFVLPSQICLRLHLLALLQSCEFVCP